jgi:hypothetical protein
MIPTCININSITIANLLKMIRKNPFLCLGISRMIFSFSSIVIAPLFILSPMKTDISHYRVVMQRPPAIFQICPKVLFSLLPDENDNQSFFLWIMSYGDGIKLLSPVKTRSGYLAEVRKMLGAYPEF